VSKISREAALLRRKIQVHPSDLPSHVARTARLNLAQRRSERNDHSNERYVAHYGVHLTGDNAGDVLLYDLVERLFKHERPSIHWRQLPLRSEVTPAMVSELNRQADAVVVGGGGLIFPKTATESRSGWQWNIGPDSLRSLKAPLVLFAIGVNTFRNQEGFSNEALEHLHLTSEKAEFIGLRNRGSIDRFLKLVPGANTDVVRFQPCPTTVLGEFVPLTRTTETDRPLVAVNVAMDKANLRFKNPQQTLIDLSRACAQIVKSGARLVVVTHADADDAIVPRLHAENVQFEIVRLERRLPQEIVDFYSKVDLTLGMRGHAQMIPFGCGGMILSLISHDKLGFFLDDIGHPEWGVDVNASEFGERVASLAVELLASRESNLEQVRTARQKLWEVTTNNMKLVLSSKGGR